VDLREQLRRDHARALAELAAISQEDDAARAQGRLARLRTAWRVHALAEETVVYRALEGTSPTTHSDERFDEHERVESLFQELAQGCHGTQGWKDRVNALRSRMTRHIENEEGGLFVNLSERYSAAELLELGTQFILVRDKLGMLEAAKKAA
jgi:hemerythrin superfamily protein